MCVFMYVCMHMHTHTCILKFLGFYTKISGAHEDFSFNRCCQRLEIVHLSTVECVNTCTPSPAATGTAILFF